MHNDVRYTIDRIEFFVILKKVVKTIEAIESGESKDPAADLAWIKQRVRQTLEESEQRWADLPQKDTQTMSKSPKWPTLPEAIRKRFIGE